MRFIAEPEVAIVLSTFNGEAYLAEQLDSIRNQTYRHWHVLLRDDGSTDATRQMVEDVSQQDPNRFKKVPGCGDNLGVVAAYSKLVDQAEADYILFCDQDDIWLSNKISQTMVAMRDAEQRHGHQTPLLIHTDLQVVDRVLRPLSPSLWQSRQLKPVVGMQLHRLLAQNVVTGCTMMINRPLANLAAPFPESAPMHDWWLALVACLFGQVVAVDQATVLYRQHGDNRVGANQWGWRRMLRLAGDMEVVRSGVLASIRQAQLFLDRYGEHMRPEQKATVTAYASLPSLTRRDRLMALLAHRFCKQGWIRSAGWAFTVFMLNEI